MIILKNTANKVSEMNQCLIFGRWDDEKSVNRILSEIKLGLKGFRKRFFIEKFAIQLTIINDLTRRRRRVPK